MVRVTAAAAAGGPWGCGGGCCGCCALPAGGAPGARRCGAASPAPPPGWSRGGPWRGSNSTVSARGRGVEGKWGGASGRVVPVRRPETGRESDEPLGRVRAARGEEPLGRRPEGSGGGGGGVSPAARPPPGRATGLIRWAGGG